MGLQFHGGGAHGGIWHTFGSIGAGPIPPPIVLASEICAKGKQVRAYIQITFIRNEGMIGA